MSLSRTNTHTIASSCPRQEHEHPSYRGDRDTNLHGVTHLFIPIPSPHASPFLSNFRNSLPPTFLDARARSCVRLIQSHSRLG